MSPNPDASLNRVLASDLNGHLHCQEPRPSSVMRATIKTSHIVTVHPHRNAKAHRPTYAVVANVGGRIVLGARFACGGASKDVRPAPEIPAYATLCMKCERVHVGYTKFVVYAYYDREGTVLYVGQTADLDARHRAHANDTRSARWFFRAVHRAVLSTHASREDACAAEVRAIANLGPLYNIVRPLHLLSDEGVA